jgi:uncharacterized protein (TIGR02569 family)
VRPRHLAPGARPPLSVLRAFGAEAGIHPLPGGQGTSWRAGGLVLKPGGGRVYEWVAEALAEVDFSDVRVARPVAAGDGAWSVGGWTAARWVEGREPDPSAPFTWLEVVEAGRAFHRAVAHLARAGCLAARHDPWALADRAAWGERPIRFRPELADVARRLQAGLGPLGSPQIVHGDLTGNVLFAPELPPAVIDVSPYWRPAAYAEGIVVADALCWHEARPSLLRSAGVPVEAVARGLLFRLATTSLRSALADAQVDVPDEARRYRRAAQAIGL